MDYRAAAMEFKRIIDFEDSKVLAEECLEKAQQARDRAALEQLEAQKKRKRNRIIFLVLVVICAIVSPYYYEWHITSKFFENSKLGKTKEVIKAINGGINVNTKDKYGYTALMYAALQDDAETVNALLEIGADINAKSNSGLTALMLAAYSGHLEIIDILIKAGADVNARKDNYDGLTVLMEATSSKWTNTETVNALLDAGADVKAKDNDGKTALDYARENEKLKGTDALARLERLSR